MSKYFDLTEAAELVADRTGQDADDVRKTIREFFVAVAYGVSSEGKASFKEFGGFTLKKREARTYNLFGNKFHVPEHYDIHFNPHPDFVMWVNDGLPKDGPMVRESQD